MSNPDAFRRLMEVVEVMQDKINQLDRRLNNMVREATVSKVDFEKGVAKVESQDLPTQDLPWSQRAGDISDWDPPTEKERVIVLSMDGDLNRGIVFPGGYTDDNKAPHNKGAEASRKIGQSKRTQSGSLYEVAVGGVTFSVSGSGVAITGGTVTHNGKNIGHDHEHKDVTAGPTNTGPPA